VPSAHGQPLLHRGRCKSLALLDSGTCEQPGGCPRHVAARLIR